MSMATARTQQSSSLGHASSMKRERSRSGIHHPPHHLQHQQHQQQEQHQQQHNYRHGGSHSKTVVRHNNNNGQDFSKKRRKLNFSHNGKQQPQQSQPQVVQPQVEEEDAFAPLDPNKPDEARRMQQRKRMVDKGKNTIGYSAYNKQVPRDTRKPKTMQHPRTPDHKANIPNRRWLGMVSAWRVALHQYDPPDCVSDVTMRTKQTSEKQEPPPKEKEVVIVADEDEDDYLEDVAHFEAGDDDALDQLAATNTEFFLEEDDDDDDDDLL